ncbi:MAG: efflux RND transporter periplasmic adaptor subunit [Candidatus Kapabacteria bacterium]|jgi:cobalt-zinc-cadmium efflux system membrane fusion protein|nr:efflux RND transporter periplasmic adaptor subunit [Candidatus Kapabacteria bacterium]
MKTLINLLTALILAFTVISCGKNDTALVVTKEHPQEERVELTGDQYAMAGIEIGGVETKNLSLVVKVNGMLDSPPQNVVSVSPRLGGYVRSTMLLQGLRVRKGQVLAVLEHQDIVMLQQEFLETSSRLEFAEAEFKRQEALQKENINAAKTFQQSATEYKSLLARLSALRQRLLLIGINPDKLTESSMSAAYSLVAPMDGYVTEVNITLGKFVSPNDVVCRIVNTSHIHIELMVFERDAPKLREGQRVRFTLVNDPQERTAKIYLIGREITQERTVRVHAHLDNENGRLLPNTALQALIELGEQSVSAVPDAAIVNAGGKDYIFVMLADEQQTAHHSFERVEVRRGAVAGGFTEVLLPEKFNKESKIVVKGAYSLLSAMQAGEGGDEHGH